MWRCADWRALGVGVLCAGGCHAAPAARAQSPDATFVIDGKPVRVSLVTPDSRSKPGLHECAVAGAPRPELVAPIAEYARARLYPDRVLRATFYWSRDEEDAVEHAYDTFGANFGPHDMFIVVEPRAGQGYMFVSLNGSADKYCIRAHDDAGHASIDISLDLYGGIRE
jgi:hypothetical protein